MELVRWSDVGEKVMLRFEGMGVLQEHMGT